jgi:hypothetical protein
MKLCKILNLLCKISQTKQLGSSKVLKPLDILNTTVLYCGLRKLTNQVDL